MLCSLRFSVESSVASMDVGDLYDPPTPSTLDGSSRRARSSSFSASSAPRVLRSQPTRRQSFSVGLGSTFPDPTRVGGRSEDSSRTLRANTNSPDLPDIAMYRSSPRDGRQSKQQMLESHPDLVMTGSMEQFMAQVGFIARLSQRSVAGCATYSRTD